VQEIIGDSKRLDLLKRMFLKKDSQGNKLFAGKSILDLSVGCGLVAMLAVQLGDAKQVVAIDRSNIIDAAREIFSENGLLGTVHRGSQDAENKGNDPQNAAKRHVRSRIDCIKLKTDFEFDAQIVRLGMKKLRFDVIMCSRLLFSTTSETDAFDTALLRSVIVARDRFLKPDGVLLPSRLTYHIVGVENVVYKEEKVDCKCNALVQVELRLRNQLPVSFSTQGGNACTDST
jgi:SAM-dependent methyltransferase